MKSFLCGLLLAISIAGFGQAHKFSYADLTGNNLKNIDPGDHKLDTSDKGWKTQAKIIITGVTKAELDKIVVQAVTSKQDISRNLISFQGGTGTIPVDEEIKKGEVSFDVLVDEKSIARLTFDVQKGSQTTGSQQPPSKNDADEEDADSSFNGYLGVLASANFVGNNKFLNNLTPVVNLGGVVPLIGPGEKGFSLLLDINPYLGGTIDAKDSVAYIPALMLYGKGGFVFNSYLNFEIKKTCITIMPFGFGLKFIPDLQDSSLNVIQHNIRGGIAIRYSNDFLLSGQITHGWHNLTSQSKENFNTVFSRKTTDISYLTVLAQLALRGKKNAITNYIYFEWRGLLSKERYAPFTNNAILTLGLRKTLELGAGGSARFGFASEEGATGKKRSRKVVHPAL